MSTATTDPGQEVADAQTAAETARQEAAVAAVAAAALEDRVLDGDPDVTAEELTAARGVASFARLRVEAAERRLDAATGAARAAVLGTLDAHVRAAIAPGGPVNRAREEEAFAAFRAAVRKATEKLNASLRARVVAYEALVAEARAAGVPEVAAGASPTPDGIHITTSGMLALGGDVFVARDSSLSMASTHRKRLQRVAGDAIDEALRA